MNPEITAVVRAMNAKTGKQNRVNGDAFESRCLAKVKRNSLNACRSAGSRGLFDIIDMHTGYVRGIICKHNGYVNPAERKQLVDFFVKTQKSGIYRMEIWYKDERNRKVRKKLVRQKEDIERM